MRGGFLKGARLRGLEHTIAVARRLAKQFGELSLKFNNIDLWEIHEAFSGQVLCHIKGLEDENFVLEKAGVEHNFGSFPRERMNPSGGSVALAILLVPPVRES